MPNRLTDPAWLLVLVLTLLIGATLGAFAVEMWPADPAACWMPEDQL